MSQSQSEDEQKTLVPLFRAIDELRIAIDGAQAMGNEEVAATLMCAVLDVADAIDLIDDADKDSVSARSTARHRKDCDIADYIDLVVR